MHSHPIVVVGTTADYIDLIRNACPGRAVFVTDARERARAREPQPAEPEEMLCDLRHSKQVIDALKAHGLRWNLKFGGVACFDCESLELAACIAGTLDLPFPSPEAVAACRNKLTSKQIWQRSNLPCPQAEIVRTPSEVAKLVKRLGLPVILKPLTGSGSELVFKCDSTEACLRALATMQSRLAHHPNDRMYKPGQGGSSRMDSRREFVIETFIAGREFSCDMILDQEHCEIIRIAEKLPAPDQTPGTTLAYKIPAQLPPGLDVDLLKGQLHNAARTLGLERAVCMVDFIIDVNTAYLLELTPRPGGDCLPWIIRESCGLDMFGLALDFAAGKAIRVPEPARWKPIVGVRFFAKTAGTVRAVDDSGLKRESRLRSYYLKAHPGYRINMPPEDYDSRILGHAVFEPHAADPILHQCREIAAALTVEMESAA